MIQHIRYTVAETPRPKGSLTPVRNGVHTRMIAGGDLKSARLLAIWRRELEAAALVYKMKLPPVLRDTFPTAEPVSVLLDFVFERPKSSKNLVPKVKPDVDKLARAVLDSLGAFLVDDCQVVELRANKRYGSPAGVTVTIEVVA